MLFYSEGSEQGEQKVHKLFIRLLNLPPTPNNPDTQTDRSHIFSSPHMLTGTPLHVITSDAIVVVINLKVSACVDLRLTCILSNVMKSVPTSLHTITFRFTTACEPCSAMNVFQVCDFSRLTPSLTASVFPHFWNSFAFSCV